MTAAGVLFAQATAATRKTQIFEMAASSKFAAIGEKDGNLYTVAHKGSDGDFTIKAYDRGLLQADLDYAPLNVAAQVTAVNSNANDWLAWVGDSTQAHATSRIANADSQLVFEQTKDIRMCLQQRMGSLLI